MWWKLSEQGEEYRGRSGDEGMRGWGLQVLLRPTKATVGTLAGMRWEARGGES